MLLSLPRSLPTQSWSAYEPFPSALNTQFPRRPTDTHTPCTYIHSTDMAAFLFTWYCRSDGRRGLIISLYFILWSLVVLRFVITGNLIWNLFILELMFFLHNVTIDLKGGQELGSLTAILSTNKLLVRLAFCPFDISYVSLMFFVDIYQM